MRSRVNGYIKRIRAELRRSFTQEYTPREVAGSFALGVFITMLPTLGAGLVVFVVLAYLFDRINKIALFASVLVLNPVVKWGVYAASITLGFLLLGPVEGFDGEPITVDAGLDVLVRLWVGNLILAAVATVVAYPLAYRMVTEYRKRDSELVESTVETVVEGFEELQEYSLRDDHSTTPPAEPETEPVAHDAEQQSDRDTETKRGENAETSRSKSDADRS